MAKAKVMLNIPLPEEEKELRISEILSLAHSYWERGEVNAARILFSRAESACCGMLESAAFLLTAPTIDVFSKIERLRKAEKLLLYVAQNGKQSEASKSCIFLSNLYSKHKEIRSLGYLLRAKRLGGECDEADVRSLQRRFSKLSIEDIENDPGGAYILGGEALLIPGQLKWALYFLEIAAADPGPVAGLAAMQIADLLEEHFSEDKESIVRYRALAAQKGNPEYLTKRQ